jgi:hypothetical protein
MWKLISEVVLTAVVLFGFPLIAFSIKPWLAARRKIRVTPRFARCPEQDRRLCQVLVVTDARTGEATDVRACSALDDPQHVDCRKECLSQFLQAEPAKPGQPVKPA